MLGVCYRPDPAKRARFASLIGLRSVSVDSGGRGLARTRHRRVIGCWRRPLGSGAARPVWGRDGSGQVKSPFVLAPRGWHTAHLWLSCWGTWRLPPRLRPGTVRCAPRSATGAGQTRFCCFTRRWGLYRTPPGVPLGPAHAGTTPRSAARTRQRASPGRAPRAPRAGWRDGGPTGRPEQQRHPQQPPEVRRNTARRRQATRSSVQSRS